MMITLTDAQYDAFAAYGTRNDELRLLRWLQANAPGAANFTDDDLLALVRRQSDRAGAFGYNTERERAKWCMLALMTSETFDTVPSVRAFLLRRDEPGCKLSMLLQDVARHLDQSVS